MSFYYLATPYSLYREGLEAAYADACRQSALLMASGVNVFSPICHTHGICEIGMMDTPLHELWMKVDKPFMDAACGLIVCELPGWAESKGVQIEINYFTKSGKPVVQMTPGVVPHAVQSKPRRIIGLTGYARSGKNSAAEGLVAGGWTPIAFADPVRECLKRIDPHFDQVYGRVSNALKSHTWEYIKAGHEIRRLLQRIGTEAGRDIHGQDCWLKIAKRQIDSAPGNVVITDVRFKNEVDAIHAWGGQVIRIDKPGLGPVNFHCSENLDFEVDAVIVNDGTVEALQSKLRATAGVTL